MIWSLRFHNNDGGYYWHHEPYGGDFFKAYHWPGGPAGEPYDEARFMRIVREKAWRIQDRPAPALEVPAAPELFSVTDGGIVTWRGSTGAASYDYSGPESRPAPGRPLAINSPTMRPNTIRSPRTSSRSPGGASATA